MDFMSLAPTVLQILFCCFMLCVNVAKVLLIEKKTCDLLFMEVCSLYIYYPSSYS